jgi:hypothetical protein
MISYFKYTNGDAFTLNDVDYSGFFTIVDSVAYTGKVKDSNSELLTPKQNFISNFYLKKLEFDNQYNFVENIKPYFSNSFDILNKNELDKIFDTINTNNLIVFKSLFVQNPLIVDFDGNDCHFFGLSSTNISNSDIMSGKTQSLYMADLKNSNEWAFLEQVKYGDFVVQSSQNFKYLCSGGKDLTLIIGSFVNKNELTYKTIQLEEKQEIYGIYYDEIDNTINIMINDEIHIYEGLNFISCGGENENVFDHLILVDKLQLKPVQHFELKFNSKIKFNKVEQLFSLKNFILNENNVNSVKFGNKMRTFVDDDQTLYISNKKGSQVLVSIPLNELGVDTVLAIDIRNVDDLVSILYKNSSEHRICFFDPFDFENSFKDHLLFNFPISNEYNLKFSSFDSNILFINSKTKIECRYISNPSYTSASFRDYNLKYLQGESLTFGDTYYPFNNRLITWNSRQSDTLLNINFKELSRSNTNYHLLHNSRRLYALKQPISNTYQSAINKNLEKYFIGIDCANDSFGMFLNRELFNITADILTLHTKATNSYNIKNDDVLLSKVNQIEYDLNNLKMNGNESVNTITIQRIFTLVVEIQQKLIANLVTDN